jgi:alkanesulfonate monooxygenase SsuD/methylene tetrahydromethanopterin reductase-like flavin-dependent oxidoreductase (luciferase family)
VTDAARARVHFTSRIGVWWASDTWAMPDAPLAHGHLDVYSGLPNYRNSWLRQGFDDSDLVRGGSDRLARGLVGMGSVDDVAALLRAHLDAGADHVVVQVLSDSPVADPRPALRTLAEALDFG